MRTNDLARAARDADVLRRRALQAAARSAAAAQPPGAVQVLQFSVARQACLLELAGLREVRWLGELLQVPLTVKPLLGFVQLRGRMLPVLDLAHLLSLDCPACPTRKALLVIGRDAPSLGIGVDHVDGVRPFEPHVAEHRSRPLEALRPEVVRGVTRDGQLLLDAERLLALHRGGAA
jgi:chemotaxis signal transduction protein